MISYIITLYNCDFNTKSIYVTITSQKQTANITCITNFNISCKTLLQLGI